MGGKIELRGQFVNSRHGMIKLVQIILAAVLIYLVGWRCIGTQCRTVGTWWYGPYWYDGLLPTTIFVTFIINIVQYILHLLNLMNVCDCINWRQFERIYAVLVTVLLLIGMVLETIALIYQGTWTAQIIIGEILGWLLLFCFVTEVNTLQAGRGDEYASV